MAEADPPPRRDAKKTRAAILAAAQEAFSVQGYIATGVRDITAAAGVNPALVNRYFGSKDKLYEAALGALLDAGQVTSFSRETFGKQVVAMLTARQHTRRNPLPMMLLASADPAARAITQRLLREIFIEPLALWYGPQRGEAKAACFAMLASGMTVYRDIYALAPLAGEMDETTRSWLAACFQSLID
ncbi:AcrR family transcriptional regulator [Erythromicrobium ramosum]|uniref:AcrR family transcriptional regulator n=1 Tax=Erythrobacter ramosus TaxID=35811 RepID=A0ABR6I1Y3_9SPHN|nr:TetR/AcrR family transcriptional regulator [Erythrobacter ramosus]MBB3776924.1 AcrR family transcriptional regulator [Erythrobacter ramosus]